MGWGWVGVGLSGGLVVGGLWHLNLKMLSNQFRDPHDKDEWSWNHLIFIMEIALPGKIVFLSTQDHGGRLNKKDGRTRYGDSHVKDKTS